jgi:hypothetical protein
MNSGLRTEGLAYPYPSIPPPNPNRELPLKSSKHLSSDPDGEATNTTDRSRGT